MANTIDLESLGIKFTNHKYSATKLPQKICMELKNYKNPLLNQSTFTRNLRWKLSCVCYFQTEFNSNLSGRF